MAIGIVTTKYGKLAGVELDGKYEGITYFKGIPYAKPPVGELRWRPPVDPEPWDGVKVCDTFAPAPVQFIDYESVGTSSSLLSAEFYYMGPPKLSEDCLYINICTGAQHAGEKRPVFMWYHGGGLTNGFSWEIEFDPSELARKGIVVVQVGQRLGAFGYIALPQLSAEQGGVSGNYGLMDQIKVLDWVRENIEAFGGDPDNITVGGQSGGTWRASAIAAVPACKGKIKRVINQSCHRWFMRYQTVSEAEEVGVEYLKVLGIDPNTTLEELRKLPTEALFNNDVPRPLTPGDMVHDGVLIPYLTMRETFEKCMDGIDFINGVTLGEASVFGNDPLRDYVAHHQQQSVYGFSAKSTFTRKEEFYAHFKELLGDLYDKYDFENLVPVTDENCWRRARELASLGITGRGKNGLSRALMKHRMYGVYAKGLYPNNTVYTYLWNHYLPTTPEDRGTFRDPDVLMCFHASELWYTFGSLREGVPPHRRWTELDYSLADQITSYWANFMRTGNPNGEGLPYWPDSSNLGYMELGDVPEGHEGIEGDLERLYIEYINRAYGLEISCEK